MLVFGVDIPLVEVVLAILLMVIILFIEAIIIVALQIKQMNKARQLGELLENMSQPLHSIKKAEMEQLDKLKKQKSVR